MEFGFINNLPELKRIPTLRDTVHKITQYGEDNLYPQRIKQVFLLSPIAKSCVALMASFTRGDGWQRNGDLVINEETGMTCNDLLELISEDQSLYNGFAIHINSTGIGKVHNIEYIPFEDVRLGTKNTKGRVNDVRVCINWEGNDSSLPDNNLRIQRYELYEPTKAAGEALTSGKGMVLYSTPRKNAYPLAAIDAIIEDCQSNHELSMFTLGNITNGFLSMSVFKYPSGGDTDTEEEELSKKLNQLKGARNSNSVIVAAIDEDSEMTGPLVEQIPANNNDSLFINSTINVRNSIIGSFAMPRALVGHTPEASLFTASQLADEYLYMNLRTKDLRNKIARIFNEQLGLDVGSIVPNQFADATMQPTLNDMK